ncbi:heterokaryon incompatibility protein-domain-containing protein [Phaeosphaeriaceae sp. PMI808]|nr:heterokaryon incompatibility protein-domain-containing protein [Phaeosphaeriaceae sp. PMI808]
MTNGFPFSRLPKTLQDAMTITLRLGLQYIWIDSLCIIQDDPEDLSREIAKMANTFQGAFVTISAASAFSVDQGFLSDRATLSRRRIGLPWRSTNAENGTVLIERERQAYDPAEDPINLRAWTLQEHILPRRMLVFGTRELWWTCETAVSFDTFPTQRIVNVPTVQRKSGEDRFSLNYWRSIVRDYTRRFLTYPNDKLPAIAGVASLYSEFFKSRYLAGLWEFSFLSELMWCSQRSDITRPPVRRAPTWSWASVDGEITHDWCLMAQDADASTVIGCHIAPTSKSSPFGSVNPLQCALRIECKLIKAYWGSDGKYVYSAKDGWERVGRTIADALEENLQIDVWVLPITKTPIRGLLLVSVGGDVYRRVGLVTRMWDDASPTQLHERQTILIV